MTTRPTRYEFSSRKEYKQGLAAWIKRWRLWRAERKKAKRRMK